MSTSVQPAAEPLTATAALESILDLVDRAHVGGAVSTEKLLAILARVPGHWAEYQANEASDRFNVWRFEES